jgi:hypothetical protein
MYPERPFWESRVAQERRRESDRRVGDRRVDAQTVAAERRAGFDRRSHPDRREGATGHIRNTLQILQAIHGSLLPEAEVPGIIEAAMERLWLALVEIDRLEASRRDMGKQLMMWQSGRYPPQNDN